MAVHRIDGQEQPHIKAGIFKIRVPFYHFRWEWPEAIQGFLLIAIPMSSITAHQEMLGIPFELAILMVTINSFLYNLHVCFGDPVSAGWITPAIPLIGAWGVANFAAGPERIHATIALGLLMALIFLFLGISGLGKKITAMVPNSLRIGIILGAGISSVISVAGTRMQGIEISVLCGMAISFITMFSVHFLSRVHTNKVFKLIAKYGMLPGMVGACLIAYLVGEIPWPTMDFSFIDFTRYPEIIKNYTVFGLGFPPLSTFIKAIPMAITCYIIAFGDFVFAETVTNDADAVRTDEVIAYDGNRSNIICGIRNLILSLIAPYGAVLSGPLWGATHVSILERYKHGRKDMDSIFGGLFSLNTALMLGTIWMGVVSIFKRCLQVGMSITMLVQAFACFYIAIEMCKTRTEMGVAGVTAIFLAVKGATWGLAIGLGLCIVMGAFRTAKYAAQTEGPESLEEILEEEIVPEIMASVSDEEL